MTAPVPAWRGLYAILDLPHAGGLDPVMAARELVGPGGAAIVQLRAKRASAAERGHLVRALVPVVRAAGALLVVDDDVEAARAADGVHLGQQDLVERAGGRAWPSVLAELRDASPAGFVIGLSTHTRAQVEHSAGLDLDYIGFGPILPTRSKAAPAPCVGFEQLREVCAISSHPVVAIGGLGPADALRCIQEGAAGAAMIGALVGVSTVEVLRLATALRDAADARG